MGLHEKVVERWLRWILIFFLGILGWDYGGMGYWGWRIVTVGVGIIFIVLFFFKLPLFPFFPPGAWFFLLFLVLFYTFASPVFSESLRELSKVFSYLGCFWILNSLRKGKESPVPLGSLIFIGFFLSFYGILQYCGLIPHSYWANQALLSSRFVNHNHFAGFLEMIIFLNIGLLLTVPKLKKVVFSFMLGINALAFYLASSRAGFIAFLLSSLFMVILLLKFGIFKKKSVIVFSIGLIILFSLFCFLGGGEKIWERFQGLVVSNFFTVKHRLFIWKDTLQAVRSNPLGFGLGSFPYIFPVFRSFSDRFTPFYAHNEFLQVLLEMGVGGLGIFLYLIFYLLREGFRFLKEEERKEKIIIVSILSGMAAILLHSGVDFPLHLPANAYCFALLGVYIASFSEKTPPFSSLFQKGSILLFFLILLLCIPLTISGYIAERFYLSGEGKEKSLLLGEAEKSYTLACKFFPWGSDYFRKVGEMKWKLSKLLPLQRERLRREAEESFKNAIKHNYLDVLTHLDLAWLYATEGKDKKAQKEFEWVIGLHPMNGYFHYSYATWLINKDLEKALKEFQKSLLLFHDEFGEKEVLKKCYERTQNYDKLREVIPDRAESLMELGYFLLKRGDKRGAKKAFKEALGLALEEREKSVIRRILKKLGGG